MFIFEVILLVGKLVGWAWPDKIEALAHLSWAFVFIDSMEKVTERKIVVVVQDSFGNVVQKEFSFNFC